MSDIAYKAYMSNTVICHTLTMSICTVIIVLYSCMVTTCMCICTGVCKNSRFSEVHSYMCTKNLVLYGCTLFQHRAFIACSISTQPRYSLQSLCYITISICTELSSRPTIACSICQVQTAIIFTLNFWSSYSYSYLFQLCAYRLEFKC